MESKPGAQYSKRDRLLFFFFFSPPPPPPPLSLSDVAGAEEEW